jgi:hypothetical protein
MAYVLAVPIRLDALLLSTPLAVVEAKADFTRIPYWGGEREVNPDVANISEDLVSYPFQDRALVLPAGVHLHWALPDALTRGSSKTNEGMLFPAVPNRWLVTRSVVGQSEPQRWIVESDYLSDYLYPNNPKLSTPDGESLPSVAIPFPCGRTKGERPFRYLGRVRPQQKDDASPKYLSTMGYRLTAVGYQADPGKEQTAPGGLGEPTFAALYPNCLSVFGFHDPTPPANMTGVKYEVIGWYSEPGHDCLMTPAFLKAKTTARDDLRKQFAAQHKEPTDAEVMIAALKEAHGWEIEGTPANLPDRTIFHASIAMDKKPETGNAPPDDKLTVALGNTVTEALSAYLGQSSKSKALSANLEEQLEALHLADRIDHLTLDVGPKFQHARHDRGFSAVSGGTMWTIRVPDKTHLPLSPLEEVKETWKNAEVVAHDLNQLNIAQQAYDRAVDELNSMQKQLFADWYKYMLCAYPPDDARDDYPDIDEVRYFIEKEDLRPIALQRRVCEAAELKRNRLREELETLLKNKLKGVYALQSRPGLRYYRPHEPVLLIAGDGLRLTKRHGRSGPLSCAVPSLKVDFTRIESDLKSFDALRNGLKGGMHQEAAGTWHPFSLDWSVEMQPLQKGNNLNSGNRAYNSDFISKSYQLDQDEVDLMLKPGEGTLERAASIYTGSSLMTSHAKLKLKERINAFLSMRLLKKYYDGKSIKPEERTDDYFERHVDDIRIWYDANKADTAICDPVADTILRVAAVIDNVAFHVLAQSLNGFNEALLMRKQTFQLPLAEPLGFDDAKEFTKRVAAAVGPNTYVAPQPLDDFQPIRTGGFKVLALRLVDTFGRVKDLDVKQWIATETMPQSAGTALFSVPPRLVQPARLSFQWLSGASDEIEMNSHPATTPICGWLLPNHLDNSLVVYDAQGKAQGAIAADAQWLAAPGCPEIAKENLPAHLKDLVIHLTVPRKASIEAFFSSIEAALENINPASAPQHDALALLMGRPIAVVRAQLKLEVRGLPTINQSWDAFRSDVARCLQNEVAGRTEELVRKSDGVTGVKFPVRLGDSRQLNDGLLGYWIETTENGKSTIKTGTPFHCGNESVIERAVDDGAVTLTMLIDPRGVVHVSSGILPSEALEIPQDQYAAALKALEVTFLTAPILSPASKIGLPLPAETDHAWSWVAKTDKEKWAKPAEIGTASTQASWGESLEIHDGWLRLTNSGKQ